MNISSSSNFLNRVFGGLICSVFVLLYSLPVLAESTKSATLGSLSLGQRSMDFAIRGRQFNAQFTTLELALSKSFKPYFVSLNVERSINTAIESYENGLIFYDRTDASLTAGARLTSYMILFGGYRQGTTSSQYYNGSSSDGSVKSNGPFGGVSFSVVIAGSGAVSFSIAVAQLAGEVPFNEPFATRPTGIEAPNTIEGSALGYSYGLRWTAAIARTTSYNVQLRVHRYTFDDQVVFGGVDLSYDENFSSLSMGLTHNF